MNIVAIRGATTINHNTREDILEKTEELLAQIIQKNKIDISQIISITFTATKDITQAYPAIAARQLGITRAALMCMQEMYVEGSLPMCIRVMLQIDKANNPMEIQHIYLHKAKKLRPDLLPKLSIAIDGPAGAGKSTIAKKIADTLNYVYIDTGAMYRAVAYYCRQHNIHWEDEHSVNSILDNIDIKYLNNEDVSNGIRTQEIANGASVVATYEKVRKKLVQLQRELAKKASVVMDGRDIGTHVLPNANLKIYLTASVSERAKRRFEELTKKGANPELVDIEREIIDRDYNDSNREISPLCKAHDAIEVDTTHKSIDEVVKEILNLVEELA